MEGIALENINQGLFIFAIGMVILFLALGLLALMINLLGRYTLRKKTTQETAEQPAKEEITDPSSQSIATEKAAVAAAVAVSHLLSEMAGQRNLGKLLEMPPGRYRFHQTLAEKPIVTPTKKG
jgi:Na+-transporting methylmalonyl-CoA/oxaloacetate decarboxylase gamma subunit